MLWKDPSIVDWTQQLLNSYRHWIRKDLVQRTTDTTQQARMLFEAPFVMVSHGAEQDPILNYGNQAALDLWEMSWEEFISTPSRLTAEVGDRIERGRMLERARIDGYFIGYRGVRVSSTGRRFLVEQAVIWNVIDPTGNLVGQAAMFSHWSNVQ